MDYERVESTPDISTSSWAGRRARSRLLLGNVWALLTSVTAGRSSSESFAWLDPDGCWRRMYQGCYWSMMDGYSEPYSGSWPKWGIVSDGVVGALPMLALPTVGNACLFWPTVTTDTATRKRRYAQGGTPLSLAVNWPTPQARDYVSGQVKRAVNRPQINLNDAVMWPTPVASEADHGGPNQRDSRGNPSLTAAVRNWPTPRTNSSTGKCDHGDGGQDLQTAVAWSTPATQDAKNATLPPSQKTRDTLPGDLMKDGAYGQLNPDWVETLQGYPVGWTLLPAAAVFGGAGGDSGGGKDEGGNPMIEPMKALTIWQPWASLLACGVKLYETRNWATNYRGPIVIHAGAFKPSVKYQMETIGVDTCMTMMAALVKVRGIREPFALDDLPRGCIIATAELVGCYFIASEPKKSMFRNDHSFLFYEDQSSPYSTEPLEIVHVQPNVSVKFGIGKNEALFGDWTPGRYAWELRNVQMLAEPIPAKGRQGLWTWEGVA